MELRRFTDVAEFAARAEPYLLRHEAEHNLILGLCAGLIHGQAGPAGAPPYLAIVEDEGQPVAVALRTPPRNVVLSRARDLEALELLVRDLHLEEGRAPECGEAREEGGEAGALPGVVGPTAESLAFAERWRALTGRPFHRAMAMRIYQLAAVNPVRVVPGRARRVTAADRALLAAWLEAFGREAMGEGDRAEAERAAEQYLSAEPRLRGALVWEDGAPVSLAGYSGPTPSGMRVGPVYTPPEHRRKGYASACVAALSRQLLAGGRRFCYLYTDLANPTSNHIYQTIGYAPVCDVDEYRFG